MKIVSIFDKNLFAIKYTGQTKDEFSRLFELWQDSEYLERFFETHKKDLKNGLWGTISVEEAIIETFNNAQDFEQNLLELSEQSENDQLLGLEKIFNPLNDFQTQIFRLGKSKAKATWLRIYALRVNSNIYIITGGAIKLTQKMQDRKHTNVELSKIKSCRKYLIDHGIDDIDKVISEIEIKK